MGTHDFISGCSSISNFIHDMSFVLFNLRFHLLQLINLFRHLLDSILMFPLQISKDRFMLNIGLLNILSKLGNFSFSFLVKLNLSMGCTTSFIKTLSKLFNFSSKIRSLSLSLSSGLTFILKFLNTALGFLDIFLHLGNKRLLIIKFGCKTSNVLFLPGNRALNFFLGSLKLSNKILSHLKFTFNLSTLLF